jgi:hypothetical protein
VERDWDKTESLVPFISRSRREHDKTLTNLSDFQYFGTRQDLWKDKQKDGSETKTYKGIKIWFDWVGLRSAGD